MTYDAIIFDIDGTLWNACPACAAGWNEGLKKLGIAESVKATQIENVAGQPFDSCIDTLFPDLMQEYPRLATTLNECEIEAMNSNGGTFYKGVIEGMPLIARIYKVFLVSNCQEWYMERFLQLSGFQPLLSGFDCHGMSGLSKTQMLIRMTKEFSLKHAVYVGDTRSDEYAAQSAGLDFIHLSHGFGLPSPGTLSCRNFSKLMEEIGIE